MIENVNYALALYAFAVSVFVSYLTYRSFPYPYNNFVIPIIYSVYSKLCSIIYLSSISTYMSEIDKISQPSLVIIIKSSLTAFIVFIILRIGIKFIRVSQYTFTSFQSEKLIYSSLICVLILLYLLNILLSGQFIINRHEFFINQSFVPREAFVFGILLIFVVPLSFIVFETKSFFYIFVSLYFLYLIMSGQKFHGILFPAILFYSINSLTKKIYIPKRILITLGIFVVTLVSFDLSKRGISSNFSNTFDVVLYRIFVLQGSVAYELSSYDFFSINNLSILSNSFESREFFISSHLIESFNRHNINLSTGLLHISSLGISNLFLFIIIILLLAFSIKIMVHGLLKNNPTFVFLSSYVYMFALGSFDRGSIADHGIKILFLLLIFFIYQVILKYHIRIKY